MKEHLEKQQRILKELVRKYRSGRLFNIRLKPVFDKIDRRRQGNLWLLGAGKAAVEMARQAEAYFGDEIKDGIIISPDRNKNLKRVQSFKGTHPYPGEQSVSASMELAELAESIPAGDTVLFCLSGGASSLYCIPPDDVEIDELQYVWKLLLECGAGIKEINVVRKHVSVSSGGRLGQILSKNRLCSVILSDVPGDEPQHIGSGPTVEDPSTFKEAFQIMKKYGIWEEVPHSIRIHITRGMHGSVDDTPEKLALDHEVYVISGADLLAGNTADFLERQGYATRQAGSAYDEPVKSISKKICSDAIGVLSGKDELKKPAALIYYGESTVAVKGQGKGGRNQELALMAAISLEGQHPVSLLSLATDGRDGPTDAAGAIVTSNTTLAARKKKLSPENYLQQNDSYHFHEEMETLLITGPTGNNVMDLQVVLIG